MATPDRRERFKTGRGATARRLQLQMTIFTVIFVIVTVMVIVQIVRDQLDPMWPLIGFAAGLIIGTILVRTHKIGMDDASHKVVSSMTVLGIVATVVYIILMLRRDVIFGRFVSSATVISVAALAMTAGVMLGRTLVTFRSVRSVLRRDGVLPQDKHFSDGG